MDQHWNTLNEDGRGQALVPDPVCLSSRGPCVFGNQKCREWRLSFIEVPANHPLVNTQEEYLGVRLDSVTLGKSFLSVPADLQGPL